jgi:Winged helix DNA-binding domain
LDALQRLTAWSYFRQHLDRPAGPLLATLREVIAVYSTHPTAPLALLARSRNFTPAEFSELERQRQAVRVIGMRGSAFLVPTELAARTFAATRQPLERFSGNLRYANLDFDAYHRLVPIVLECCSRPVSRSELGTCAGVPEDVYIVARVLAREGKILRVGASLRTDQLKWVATAAWLGQPLEELDQTAALAWLADAYLRAFGPARVTDFSWWAGIPRRAAAAALAKVPTLDIDGLLLHHEDVSAYEATGPLAEDALAVLPKWDSYTMAYAPDGRQRLVADEHVKLAYTSVAGSPGATAGDGLPLILLGGQAVATWSHRFAGNSLAVSVQPWPGFSLNRDALETRFESLAATLSASSLQVTYDDD